jgi:hypothetical protein
MRGQQATAFSKDLPMATNSILGGGQAAPRRARGRDVDALGPSDSSDSGSDVQGERPMPTLPDNPGELGALPVESGSDTDASGTGERASATGIEPREAADISPDRISAGPSSPPTAETPLASDTDIDIDDLAADIDSGNGDDAVAADEAAPDDQRSGPDGEGAGRRASASRSSGGPTGRVRRVRAADAAKSASVSDLLGKAGKTGKPHGPK